MMHRVAALLLLVSSVAANKDDAYYTNGVTNPNVEQPMYWHQGYNVLQDLSQFDKLYVSYHNCAWETPTGNEEHGGGGGDGDDWYMGSVPSFRANVAYSLYGILKGQADNGCNKKTYINSFHTTQGLESFTNAMAAAGLTDLFSFYDGDGHDDSVSVVTSTCNQDDEESADGDDAMANGQKYYQSSSYGLGCSIDGKHSFAIHTYLGAYCDANAITETTDALEDLNGKLSQSQCVPIYTGGYYSMDDDEVDSPLDVLATSRACSIHDGTNSCPDPYGQLKQREKALNKATAALYEGPFWTVRKVMVTAWSMIATGIFLTVSAIIWAIVEGCKKRKRSRHSSGRHKKKHRKSRKKSKKSSGDINIDEAFEDAANDEVVDPPAKPSRDRSELSEALASVASKISQISQTFVDATAAVAARRASKKSKDSKSSKKSKRSKESRRRSHQTDEEEAPPPQEEETHVNLCISPPAGVSPDAAFQHSKFGSKAADPEGYMASDDHMENIGAAAEDFQACASESVAAMMDVMGQDSEDSIRATTGVHDVLARWQQQQQEAFNDEPEDDESVEIKIKSIPDVLPRSTRPSSRRTLAEAEVDSNWTEREESASKKKWRKRRWFQKLVGK